jgi:DNA polymerase-3 subunit epsilon
MAWPERKLLSPEAKSLWGHFDKLAEPVKLVATNGPLEKEIRSFVVSVAERLKRDSDILDWNQDFPSNEEGYIWVQLHPKAWKLPRVDPIAFSVCWSNPFVRDGEDLFVGVRIPWNWVHAEEMKSALRSHVPADFTDVPDQEDCDKSDVYWRRLRFQDYVQDSQLNAEAFYQAILSVFKRLLPLRPVIDEYLSQCADVSDGRLTRRQLGVVAVVDTETVDTRPELVELAIINAVYDKQTGDLLGILDQYEGVREPKCGISKEDRLRNRLKMEQVRGKTLDEGRIKSLLSRADFVVAHNASFDRARLEEQFEWARDLLKEKWRDSLHGVVWKAESKRLQSLLADHKVDCKEAHRAGPDARALLELLSYGGSGRTYLSQLVSVTRKQNADEAEIASAADG